jgi:hypothetical protein
MIKQKEVYWSLSQAIAWLMFQTEESAFSMGSQEHPSETRLIIWQEIKKITPYRSIDEAEEELLFALQSGTLSAFGQQSEDRPSEEIPALHWKDLRCHIRRHDGNIASLKSLSNAPDWYDIAFLKEDVKRLFPSRNERRKKTKKNSPEHSPSITQRQRSFARKYYDDLIKKGVRTNRDDDFLAFREAFPSILRNNVRKLRQEMVPEWCNPGRPSSKNKMLSVA